MGTALPVHAFPLDQPHIRFVYKCGRLKQVPRSLARHVPRRDPVQLLVDVETLAATLAGLDVCAELDSDK